MYTRKHVIVSVIRVDVRYENASVNAIHLRVLFRLLLWLWFRVCVFSVGHYGEERWVVGEGIDASGDLLLVFDVACTLLYPRCEHLFFDFSLQWYFTRADRCIVQSIKFYRNIQISNIYSIVKLYLYRIYTI